MFHFISQDGLVFLNVSQADSGRRIPFAALTEMQKEVRSVLPFRYMRSSH